MSVETLFNIPESATQDSVDETNSKFYSRFSFPWVPAAVPHYDDKGFWLAALNQDLGYWDQPRFVSPLKIWVAGCGTNQAVMTALRFPDAEVTGSDISPRSLEACQRTAEQTGVRNLTLKQESLNDVDYSERFDYIISTGVIHHNADPSVTLQNIVRALKPDGVLELMVYNYYHRLLTTAFQKAIRILGGGGAAPNLDQEMALARSMMDRFPVDNMMKGFLEGQSEVPEAALADMLLQPVEYSYTIATLAKLAGDSGLELLVHCLRSWDRYSVNWNLRFHDREAREVYDGLEDIDRWQVSNLLMGERSPLLWFYMQKQSSRYPRIGEKELCERFLDAVFVRHPTKSGNFVLRGDRFERDTTMRVFPAPEKPTDPIARAIYDRVDGVQSMRSICRRLGIGNDFHKVNHLRLHLATGGFPYMCSNELVSVFSAKGPPSGEIEALG